MQLEVRLFGGLAAHAGATRVTIALESGATVADLRQQIAAQVPAISELLGRVKVAVDLEVANDDVTISPDAEVALLPPVAGGSGPDGATADAPTGDGTRVAPAGLPESRTVDGVTVITGLCAPPFDVSAVLYAVGNPEVGGTAIFLGTVRDHAPDLADVIQLEYSAYPAMADKVLADIARETIRRFSGLRGIALLHAVGTLDVGSHTILIVCASPHRDLAFAACRHALEAVKDDVPIWKRERTTDGVSRWVGLPDVSGQT